MTPETVRHDLERVIAEVRQREPRLRARARVLVHQRPYLFDQTSPIAQTLARAYRAVTGREIRITTGLPAQAYVTDAADMVRAGIPTALFGPGDWKMVPDKRIRMEDLMTAARVYAATAAAVITGGLP
jgi:acetylornithine deacetylase/succinyl-diaminopimelate desuccinylase-like protein